MGRARDDIRDITVVRQNTRQGLYDRFNPLIWREQTEGQQYGFAPNTESVLVKIRIHKRQIWDSMRDYVNLCRWNSVDLLKELRGMLAHDNEAVGDLCEFDHHAMLVRIRFTQHRMKGGHDRHAE